MVLENITAEVLVAGQFFEVFVYVGGVDLERFTDEFSKIMLV